MEFPSRPRWMCVLLALAMIALLAPFALAQSPTGVIRVTVTDPTGAVVPSATVTITESSTGRNISMKGNSAGQYVFSSLLPGDYKVKVSAASFKTLETTATVQVGQTAEVPAKLEVGASDTAVEVNSGASAVQVDTVRSTVDGVITGKQIDQLPLNARNFLELAAIEPGVQVADGGNIDPTKSQTYRTIQVLGRSGTGTRVTIDGIDITDETVGTTMANISDDAVQEFQLSQSSLDLSTSLTSSGAVNIVSRSGGNTIHGSGFEFYRNQAMGARLGFDPKAEPFHRHQVGFRVGGPFKKDKLFWFVNWERTYQQEQSSYTTDANLPTIAGHNCQTGCFAGVPLGIRMIDGRLDYNLTNNIRMFYRFGDDWNLSTGGSIPVSPFQNVDWNNNHTVGLDWAQMHLTHSFRFGYVKFNNRIISQSFPGFSFLQTPQGNSYNLGVGAYLLGPNGLAPQATAQDNYVSKYDGTWVHGNHVVRFGGEFDHIQLGGFANFAGPLTVSGDFSGTTQAAVAAGQVFGATNDTTNPLNYPLSGFSGGPANGFFTIPPCDGFAHGCHTNNRIDWYIGDTWKARPNLTLNFGTRWEHDTGYFNNEAGITRPSWLNYFLPGAANHPNMGYNKFGPQFGFAYDPIGNGKTVIRGGGYMAYEMNIYNNLIFDQFNLIPPGIGPDAYDNTYWGNPDGTPITPAQAGINVGSLPPSCQTASAVADMNGGVYNCMTEIGAENAIASVIGPIGQLQQALLSSYANYKFDPSSGAPLVQTAHHNVYGYLFGGDKYKIPYSLQWNIGVQHELAPGVVLTADFLVNHGVHVGGLGQDMDCQYCASTLNVSKATAAMQAALGTTDQPGTAAWTTDVNNWIAAHPGKTISSFGLAGSSVFQGRTPDPSATDPIIQNTNFTSMSMISSGGYSLYKGLQVSLKGRIGNEGHLHGFVRNGSYQVSWAWASSQATNGAYRTEFLNGARDKRNPVDGRYFGYVPEDHRHMVSIGMTTDTIGGFRLSPFVRFYTPSAATLAIPQTLLTGQNSMFSIDETGSGYTGTNPLPGTHYGSLGRDLNSWDAVNRAIAKYNSSYAGNLTPAGQALVTAGLFTQSQMAALHAVYPTITPVPTSNPWPYQDFFNMDLGITRPIKLARIREGFEVEPWIQFFNIFNYNSLGSYGGSTNSAVGGLNPNQFGSLNYPYQQSDLVTLAHQRGRQNSTRLFQIGVRVNF